MNFKPTTMKGMLSFILTVALYILVNSFSFMPEVFTNTFIPCGIKTLSNKCVFTFIGTWIGFYIILSLFQSKYPKSLNRIKNP